MKSVRFQLRAKRKETNTPVRVESESNPRYFTVLWRVCLFSHVIIFRQICALTPINILFPSPPTDRSSWLIAEYCNADRTTWKLNLQDINTTPKELKTERDCSHRQLFRGYFSSELSLVVMPYWRAPKRAKQLSMVIISRSVLSSFGVVLMSCKVNFHVVRHCSILLAEFNMFTCHFCW